MDLHQNKSRTFARNNDVNPMKRFIPVLAVLAFYSCKDLKNISENPPVSVYTDQEIDKSLLDEYRELPTRPIYNPSEKRINDLLHTRLEVSFDYSKQHLFGKAILDFKPYFYPTDSVWIDARGFDLHSVQLKTPEGNKDIDYSYSDDVIRITLDRVYTREETYQIAIDYTAKPNELEAGGSAAITSDKGLYFINPLGEDLKKPIQIWTQGETESNSCWFPTIDSPNERMTQELFITVSDDYKTLSNGEMVYSNFNDDDTHTDYWKMDLPHAPYLTMMAIGDYRIGMDKWQDITGNEIPVNYYIEDEYSDYVFNIFGNTPEMMTFYSDLLDYPYPWNKYSQVIVRDYVSGAMENTTATIHGEFLNATARELLDGDNEDIIAHELFHQWFGNLVTCENWANLPLNESFATYGEYLWIEHKYGVDAADYHGFVSQLGYLQEAKYEKKKMIRYGYTDKEAMFDGHSYNKGGRILHMLRNYVGDEAFFMSLSKYLKDNAYTAVEIHNLRLAFEEVTGEDLNWFFDQWFLGKGHPVLDISYEWQEEGFLQKVKIKQTQNTEEEGIFRLPFAIDIYEGTDKTRHMVVMDQVEQEFVFKTGSKPTWVNVDGDKMLLCEKIDQKSNLEFVQQFYEGKKFLDRYEAIAKASETEGGEVFDRMIVDALMDRYEEIKLLAIESIDLVKDNKLGAENILKKLCLDDESSVRAEAVNALGNHFEFDQKMDCFDAALKDPSYRVMAAGLTQMAHIDPERGLEECKKLESETSFEIQNAIALIYSIHGSSEQHDYFINQSEEVNGYGQYVFLQNYSSYLLQMESPEVEKGVNILTDAAENAEPWWVKLSAYRGMNQLLAKYDAEMQVINNSINASSDQAEILNLEQQKTQLMSMIEMINSKKDLAISKETNQQVLQSIGK